MTYKNGYIYIGEWKNGYKHGKGVYINSKSQDKFEGEFKRKSRRKRAGII